MDEVSNLGGWRKKNDVCFYPTICMYCIKYIYYIYERKKEKIISFKIVYMLYTDM